MLSNRKKQISEKVSVGHRYFCLMALAVYAAKCNIEEEEFMKDLESFVEPFDGISYTRNEDDRFTIEDALDAAAAYRECYCTFPIEDLRDITGIEIERNKTRKFKKQDKHLEEARAIRDVRQKRNGKVWDEDNGRKSKQLEVFQWRQNNPEGSKYACAKELGIDKKTVMKWWDATEDTIEQERVRRMERIEDRRNPAKMIQRLRLRKQEERQAAIDAQKEYWDKMDNEPEFREWQERMLNMSREELEELARVAEMMKNKRSNK